MIINPTIPIRAGADLIVDGLFHFDFLLAAKGTLRQGMRYVPTTGFTPISETSLTYIKDFSPMEYKFDVGAEMYVEFTVGMDINFFGAENTAESLRKIARFYDDPEITQRTEALIVRELARIQPEIARYRQKLAGKRAAIYVGGAYKAVAIIRQLRELGMEIAIAGTQTGKKEEYATISGLLDEGAIVVDDTNPAEIERFLLEKNVDVMAGGVKERVLAYKLGIGFVDHNHDRKECLAGFEGAVTFAREVYVTTCSPVWKHLKPAGGA